MIGAWFSRLVGTKFTDGDRLVKTALRNFIHYHSCCLQGRPCDGNRWCKEVRFGSRLCENAAVAAQWKVGAGAGFYFRHGGSQDRSGPRRLDRRLLRKRLSRLQYKPGASQVSLPLAT